MLDGGVEGAGADLAVRGAVGAGRVGEVADGGRGDPEVAVAPTESAVCWMPARCPVNQASIAPSMKWFCEELPAMPSHASPSEVEPLRTWAP